MAETIPHPTDLPEAITPDPAPTPERPPLPPINLLTIGAVMSAALWIGRYELQQRLVL